MKHAHPNSDLSRFENDIRPLINGILQARRITEEDQGEARKVSSFLKYHGQNIERPDFTEYSGDDQRILDTLEIFEFDTLLNFQEDAWTGIFNAHQEIKDTDNSKGVLLSAPTGYGKTEGFLGPILKLLEDEEMDTVVLVYPRKDLLEDQLGRVLEGIHRVEETYDHKLEVGMWHGDIENRKRDVYNSWDYQTRDGNFAFTNCEICDSDEVVNFDWKTSSSRGWYGIECPNGHKFGYPQLKLHRGEIKNSPPDILLTTLESMEQFTLKPNYRISEAMDAIVFDETHLYEGIYGAHAANVIKNIKSVKDSPLLLAGSSATLDAAESFTEKIFDLPQNSAEVIEVEEEDKKEAEEKEHLFFVESADEMGLASTYIQETMLLSHCLLQEPSDEGRDRSTSLNFIDSISQINQREKQLEDAESEGLWSYHQNETEDWPDISTQMGKEFIDEPLDIKTNHSQTNLSSSDLEEAEMIISSSSMEVGVDLPGIRIVTQYSAPMNYASFVQRIGRAARQPGEEAYLMMVLNNNGQDSNLLYRADRFLDSEVDIPLNVDNPIVKWIHDKNLQFYKEGNRIYRDGSIPEDSKEIELLKKLFNDNFDYEEFWTLLDNPEDAIGDILDEEIDARTLLSQDVIERLLSDLDEREEEIEEEFEEILEYTDQNSNVLLQSDTLGQLLEDVEEKGLKMIDVCGEELTKDIVDAAVEAREMEEDREEILQKLKDLRSELEREKDSNDERLRVIRSVSGDLHHISGDISQLEHKLLYKDGKKVHDVELQIDNAFSELGEFEDKLDTLDNLTADKVEEYGNDLKRVYYLKKSLENLDSYLDVPYRKWSLHAFKGLMRSAYFYDRFLQVSGEGYGEKVWYTPKNYFGGGGGKNVTFVPDFEYDDNWEEPLTKIFGKYSPYRTQYKQSGPYLQVFQPKTKKKDSGEVVFDFSNIDGTRKGDIIIPDSIPMKDVLDRTQEKANGVVDYCPECYHLLGKEDQCPRHSESSTGRIHGSPKVSSSLENFNGGFDGIDLQSLTVQLSLDGVELEITPNQFYGGEWHPDWDNKKEVEIGVEGSKLGISYDTRVIIWKIGDIIDEINLDEEMIRNYREEDVSLERIKYHTTAHFLTLLISDVTGVNPSLLHYGYDSEKKIVYVFEESEGGQGIADYFHEMANSNPGKLLKSTIRVGYNTQIENEKIWTDEDFTDLWIDIDVSEETEELNEKVKEKTEILYPEVISKISQEALNTYENIQEVNQTIDEVSLDEVLKAKRKINKEKIQGNEISKGFLREEFGDIPDGRFDAIRNLLIPPDVDGCMANLHLSNCKSNLDQEEVVSYRFLRKLMDKILKEVSDDEREEKVIEEETLSAGKLDGKSIFISF